VWCDEISGGLIDLEKNLEEESSSCSFPNSPLDMSVAIKFNLYMQLLGGNSGLGLMCAGHSSLLEMPLLSYPLNDRTGRKVQSNAVWSGFEMKWSA